MRAFLVAAFLGVAGPAPAASIEDVTPAGAAVAAAGVAERGDVLISAPAQPRSEDAGLIRASLGAQASAVNLVYAFGGWSRGQARIDVVADRAGEQTALDTVWVKQGPDASATFAALGVTVRLTATGLKNRDAIVEVLASAAPR